VGNVITTASLKACLNHVEFAAITE
jgi:hypothetical protein